MKLPRDTDTREPIKALQRTGYQSYATSGSHIRLQSGEPKPHSLTIPHHPPSAFAGMFVLSVPTFGIDAVHAAHLQPAAIQMAPQ